MAKATLDRFNIQLLHPTLHLLKPDLQFFLHQQVHRCVPPASTEASCFVNCKRRQHVVLTSTLGRSVPFFLAGASPLVSEFLSFRTAMELAYSGLLQQPHVFACCSALGQLARAVTLANDPSFSAWRSPPPFGGIGNPGGPGSPTFRGASTLTWSQRIQVTVRTHTPCERL